MGTASPENHIQLAFLNFKTVSFSGFGSDLAVSAARDLSAQLDPGRVLLPGPSYDEARRTWNGAVEHRPALIVRCQTPAEVQAAVGAARHHHLPLSVRGGGHDWAGRALRHGGLVIDLTGMRQVTVDPAERVATVAGGATAGDLISAAALHHLSAATGMVGFVGMAGLTLGGGYGPLNGRFGLALDNLLGAEIVLADGRLVTTHATHEPELYWALRGGGGNFGVVTSMRIRLHPVHQLLAGLIMYPWSQVSDIMGRLNDILAAAPDELTIQTGILSGLGGSPILFLAPAWSGDLTHGEKAIDELHRLGTPLFTKVAAMTYTDLLAMSDARIVNGHHYAGRTRSVTGFTPDVISALIEAGSTLTSPLSGIPIHHFHGVAARIPSDSTAFGNRHNHLMIEVIAAWHPDDENARHRAWTESVSTALAPSALPGGYPNMLGPDDHQQIAHAYGHNTARLRAAKTRFDPDGIFSATPLSAGSSPGA